ncbi:MAG: ATP-binding protein [Oscillospiraceae bacterium]|nr:ATP-binding protein [Oscillospiraceae bacterium]
MPENKRTLPMSVQDFEKLRKKDCVYVDKIEYIYNLVHDVAQFFLSRPRRFGKSLLLSTLRAYWEGKKELFVGLAIEKLETENEEAWQPHPVFYFDFNGRDYHKDNALETALSSHLERWEEKYEIDGRNKTLEDRFQNLLMKVSKKTGQECVVLVDEYDKPLLDLIDMPELLEHNKAVFKGFFSNLKNCDAYIRFVFITGVTKFHKVSIFSDLNQLRDISLNKYYSGMCGITEDELRKHFSQEIDELADEQGISNEECLEKLKMQYDGYKFHQGGVNVYNPYSLINAFSDKEFGSYWFETGTPTFLIKRLKEISFEPHRFTDRTLYASASMLKDYSAENPDPIPLLYQTGYLTIVDYDADDQEYTLAFPNHEVQYGFLDNLMPEYVSDCGSGSGIDIFTFRRYIKQGNLDKIRDVLATIFARISYTRADDPFENYFQAVIWLTFTLLKQFADCEIHTSDGRIDCRVLTSKYIYLFEFKRDESAEKALKQIDDKSYALPFQADDRKLFKIGVSFDSKERKLADWKVAE